VGDTWIVDITHYLLPGGILVGGPAGRIARYFGSIIAAASTRPAGVWADTDLHCRRRPGRRPCPGHIRALRLDAQDVVKWHCSSCDDNGLIQSWKGSMWDLSQPIPDEQAPPPDRRALERTISDLTRHLADRQFGSFDELNACMRDLTTSGGVPRDRPLTPVERAQDIVYDAWDVEDPRERVRLALKALEVSPDCADAYVLLAEEAARSLGQALSLYERGVAAGERALGKRAFEDEGYVGHFWGIVETRPYMRARRGLAMTLWQLGRKEEAVEHYREMLRLNPNDNQGIRYVLLAALLELDAKPDLLKELFELYPDDAMADWLYGRALLAFRDGGGHPGLPEAARRGEAG